MKKQNPLQKSKLDESDDAQRERKTGSRGSAGVEPRVRGRRAFLKTATACAASLAFNPFRSLALANGSNVGGPTFRTAETFDDAHAASCRVRVSGASGSGTFVGVAGGLAWILTNYHVVGRSGSARLDFWTNSVLETVDASVKWRAYDASRGYDFAFCTLDPAELARIAPPFVWLGGPSAAPSRDAFIVSSGCPDGRFAQAWRGKIVSFWNDSTALFQPPPVPGQSGSGVLERVDGRLTLVAVLTWLVGERGRDDSKGGAIPVANLHEAAAPGAPAAAPFGDPIPPGAVECRRRPRRSGPALPRELGFRSRWSPDDSPNDALLLAQGGRNR